ncbi:hypothetical protein DERF_004250 [Dermatophagoides farinae]|uniref:Uncharacterized protein n=1 Tax=Dermatophagoides farinae TaxID=6954 RepID=A0A922I2T9_DERFA|nr:hypothetical protein DERF_004250 [Dermatophagoides farinae]
MKKKSTLLAQINSIYTLTMLRIKKPEMIKRDVESSKISNQRYGRQEKMKNDPVNMINQSMIVYRNMIDKFLSDIRHGGGATTFTSGRC